MTSSYQNEAWIERFTFNKKTSKVFIPKSIKPNSMFAYENHELWIIEKNGRTRARFYDFASSRQRYENDKDKLPDVMMLTLSAISAGYLHIHHLGNVNELQEIKVIQPSSIPKSRADAMLRNCDLMLSSNVNLKEYRALSTTFDLVTA